MKISEFKEKMVFDGPLLLIKCNKGSTTNGDPYLSVSLQDDSGTIDGKIWNVKAEVAEKCVVGEIVQVLGVVILYQNNFQMKINDVKSVDFSLFDISEFVPASPVSIDDLKAYITDIAKSITQSVLADIVGEMLHRYQDKLYQYPAASRNHHNFSGGLATHMQGMIELALKLIELYPSLNRDLLLSGIVLHDLGKITELNGPVATEYTVEGKLLGHISIIHSEIYEYAKAKGYQNTQEVLLLRHMILSHHGELEFGSPVVPMTCEAEVLNFIDNLDARMNMLEKALNSVKAGEFTPRIFPLDNRSFYKPKDSE